MAIPKGHRRLEGSECRPARDARRIGSEHLGKTLSATIRVKQAAGKAGRDRVAAFVQAQALRLESIGGTDEIVISGTVAQMNTAFAIELGQYTWGTRTYRGYEGCLYLPAEIAELIAELIGLVEREMGADGPWVCYPGEPGKGTKGNKLPIRVTALWTVPHPGPSGPVKAVNYAFISSFDIDWLNTAGFQTMLDNMAASPGAFQTVRVMKALNSGTAELGSTVDTDQPPADDTVWPYTEAPALPAPINLSATSPTISALTELTQRGLTPFVVLGFFPDGVYTGTSGGLPLKTPLDSPTAYQNSTYGPDPGYLSTNPGDWAIILANWNKLIQAFFTALNTTFGSAIQNWWFEVWNEPDNPSFWIPDVQLTNAPDPDSWPISSQPPLYYYCQLYKETLNAIAALNLGFPVQVGGPAIMANAIGLSAGDQTNLQVALPIFLNFVYNGGASLQCDFISLHAKGDWLEYQLPNLTQVINTVESAVSQYISLPAYAGYFNGKAIFNDEADMRVGAGVAFYPRMTSQFPAWLTALMIANDSLTSEYATKGGAQFRGGSDNGHLELVGWQQLPSDTDGTISGSDSFGQQRSIMTAASAWQAGTETAPVCPQDLVKVPVYNFYELLRLLGDQHGVFISGQENFYPTDATSDLFSAITVGAPAGQLTHVCWVFCVYPTIVTTQGTPPTPQDWSFNLEVIDLPATWTTVNWVQFQIGPPANDTPDDNSFTVAQTSQIEAVPAVPTSENPETGAWNYDISTAPTQVSLSNPSFNAANVRMAQELSLVQCMKNVPLTGNAWKTPAPVDFEPYTSTVFWITPYNTTVVPATPTQATYTMPDGTIDAIPIAIVVGGNVVLRWQYPVTDPGDPRLYSFFYFQVQRGDAVISPVPQPTTKEGGRSFALRAAMWIDTAVGTSGPQPGNTYTYTITAFSASGISSAPLSTSVTV
jgi:hypothetical protein